MPLASQLRHKVGTECGVGRGLRDAEMAALAYPDRVGLHRKGDAPRFVMSGGKGAMLDNEDPLAPQRLIVATDLDGDAREAAAEQVRCVRS